MKPGRLAFILSVLAGMGLNLLLLIRKLVNPEAGIAGCGGQGGCNEVLESKWSQVLGVPVTLPGVLLYLAILIALHPRFRGSLATGLAVLFGAVIWFVSLQLFILHQLCMWCLAAHAIALITVRLGIRLLPAERRLLRASVTGSGVLLILILCQVFGPVPASHRITEAGGLSATTQIHSRGEGRRIEFNQGRKIYNRDMLPTIGAADAPKVLVEYFDYQCASCRLMRGFLDALMERHPGRITVVLLPTPLDGACNHQLGPEATTHPGSCELARIALAVWRVAPAEFPALHRALFEDPAPDAEKAMRLASERIPAARLEAALKDPWIDELLQANIDDWVSFSNKTRQLPKLLIRDTRLLHGLPSGEEEFIQVMEQELGL